MKLLKFIPILVVVPALAIASIIKHDSPKPITAQQSQVEEVAVTTPISAEPVITAVVEPYTPQTSSVTSDPVLSPTPDPVPAPAPQIDIKTYADNKFQVILSQGYPLNKGCYNNLINESTAWNINESQLDSILDKVQNNYSSTCAAYAQYRETGSY